MMEGKVNAGEYTKTISDALDDLDKKFGTGNYHFQQDNAAILTARKTSALFEERRVKVLKWSARSPDLNPMEDGWSMLSNSIYANSRYKNRRKLWQSMAQHSKKLSGEKKDTIKGPFGRMRSRLVNVIKSKAGIINEKE